MISWTLDKFKNNIREEVETNNEKSMLETSTPDTEER